MRKDTAILSNDGNMTIFHYGNQRIRFKSPDCLEKYIEVKQWDKGYIVVMTKYKDIGVEEEYIDLNPILQNLHINAENFLLPIKKVVVE